MRGEQDGSDPNNAPAEDLLGKRHDNQDRHASEDSNAFDSGNGIRMIGASYDALLFVLERYFHKQTTCGESATTCQRITDTQRLLSRNLQREERLMLEAHYPDYEEHRREHQIILQALGDFEENLVCNTYDNEAVAHLVLTWARDHANRFDKPFCDFLDNFDSRKD